MKSPRRRHKCDLFVVPQIKALKTRQTLDFQTLFAAFPVPSDSKMMCLGIVAFHQPN